MSCLAEGVVVPLGALWLILDLSTKIMALTLFWLLTVPPPFVSLQSVCFRQHIFLPALSSYKTVAVRHLMLLSICFCCCGVKRQSFLIILIMWALTKHSQSWCVFIQRVRPAKADTVTKKAAGRQSFILFLYLHGCFPTGAITQNTWCFCYRKTPTATKK